MRSRLPRHSPQAISELTHSAITRSASCLATIVITHLHQQAEKHERGHEPGFPFPGIHSLTSCGETSCGDLYNCHKLCIIFPFGLRSSTTSGRPGTQRPASGAGLCGGLVRHWLRLIGSSVLVALALAERTEAAERPSMPLKAPPAVAKPYDWGGYYFGGHFGAAWGHSDWSAAGGLPLGGALDLTQGFNAFKGTGSYFAGLQAGYNVILPSRIVLGAEADISFPNAIQGSQTFYSASTGTAGFAELVQFFGTVR